MKTLIDTFLFPDTQSPLRHRLDPAGRDLFNLQDIARACGIQYHRDVVDRLDEDEYCLLGAPERAVTAANFGVRGVGITHAPNENQNQLWVTESGLYAVVLISRKPGARRFRKWVTSEVLPALRKLQFTAAIPETAEPAMADELEWRLTRIQSATEHTAPGSVPVEYCSAFEYTKKHGTGGLSVRLIGSIAKALSRMRGVAMFSEMPLKGWRPVVKYRPDILADVIAGKSCVDFVPPGWLSAAEYCREQGLTLPNIARMIGWEARSAPGEPRLTYACGYGTRCAWSPERLAGAHKALAARGVCAAPAIS